MKLFVRNFGHSQFSFGHEKWRVPPEAGGLYLDKALFAARLKRQNVVSEAITFGF